MHFNINSLAVYAITCLRSETSTEQFHDILLLIHTHTHVHTQQQEKIFERRHVENLSVNQMTFFGDPVLG